MDLDRVSLIQDAAERVVLPFEFSLLTELPNAPSPTATDSFQSLALASAWAQAWADICSEKLALQGAHRQRSRLRSDDFVPSVESPFGMTLLHPSDYALWNQENDPRRPGSGMSTWLSQSGPATNAPTLGPEASGLLSGSRHRPSIAFWTSLEPEPGGLRITGDLFCIAVTAIPDLLSGHIYQVVFEAGFEEVLVERGSLKTTGKGWFAVLASTVILPILTNSFANDVTEPLRELQRRVQMEKIIPTVQGPCRVHGHLDVDLTSLQVAVREGFLKKDVRGICLNQLALKLVGRDPGRIDGVLGTETRAAQQAFLSQWRLTGVPAGSKEYAHALSDALLGKTPPTR